MMTWVIGSFKKGMLRKKKATINMHVGGICCLTKKKGRNLLINLYTFLPIDYSTYHLQITALFFSDIACSWYVNITEKATLIIYKLDIFIIGFTCMGLCFPCDIVVGSSCAQ